MSPSTAVTRSRRQILELLQYALVLARQYGGEQNSEDIAQKAMLHYLDADKEIRQPKAWLRTVVRRECSRHFARKKRRRELAELLPRGKSGMSLIEWKVLVKEVFSEVNERDRQLLALKLAGFSYAEIADRLDVPEDSVGTLVSRAFAHARRVLAA